MTGNREACQNHKNHLTIRQWCSGCGRVQCLGLWSLLCEKCEVNDAEAPHPH